MNTQITPILGAIENALRDAGFRLSSSRQGSELVNLRQRPSAGAIAANPNMLDVSPYDAACLCGIDPALYDGVRMQFGIARGRNMERIEMSFTEEELVANLDPEGDFGRDLTNDELDATPESCKRAVFALLAQGFRVRGKSGGAMMSTITLSRGRKVGQMGYVAGISASVTWIGLN